MGNSKITGKRLSCSKTKNNDMEWCSDFQPIWPGMEFIVPSVYTHIHILVCVCTCIYIFICVCIQICDCVCTSPDTDLKSNPYWWPQGVLVCKAILANHTGNFITWPYDSHFKHKYSIQLGHFLYSSHLMSDDLQSFPKIKSVLQGWRLTTIKAFKNVLGSWVF